MNEPKPMDPERLALARAMSSYPDAPRGLVELLADRDHQAKAFADLCDRLRAMSKLWREQAHECWCGEDKPQGTHNDGKGDGLDDCADEIDALLAEVSGG